MTLEFSVAHLGAGVYLSSPEGLCAYSTLLAVQQKIMGGDPRTKALTTNNPQKMEKRKC
jgi:hypothetical protein